ncbi:putative ribonuclease H-like domain-containing protein [Tanacetum coccineum]|uniref:Ribonuclease H-like domain-containing protein n=1 Tax=Tanacetum coccineum TaxID=301880 RepID=A0ABQ4XBB7_9ASTR
MDFKTAQLTTAAKFSTLKQENGNSFQPVAKTTTNADGTSTTLIPGPYKDAKTLFAAIQTRFGANEATKKTQKILLKQMYENFNALSIESLDFIFNRLQKIVSQMAVLGENISQEDLNLKFFKSLSSEWNTHVSNPMKMTRRDGFELAVSIAEHEDTKMRHFARKCRGSRSPLLDESMLWHRRLGHVNFKTINKLIKENLVRGLPAKRFENDQTCVACLKGKQHKASASKDETSSILKSFITEIENLVDKKKGIKRKFSAARTPQQNGVTERRNRTLIEDTRTMLADSKLPTTFWAEAANTACYVQNRVLVVKPHNKTHYELFRGRTPALSFMRPFGCHVSILNTLDHLGKFDRKSDEGFFVRYSMNSKAFKVYNIRTRKVEESLHIRFLEDKSIIAGDGPKWLFDIDVLTKSMNYVPVVLGTNSNDFVGTKESIDAGHFSKEPGSSQDYILMPLWKDGSLFDSSPKNTSNDEPQPSSDAGKKDDESGINNQDGP